MKDKNIAPKHDQDVASTEPLNRQAQFNQLIADALQNQDLVEALQAFEMGEQEYVRAMNASIVKKVFSGSTTNPDGNINAHLDTD